MAVQRGYSVIACRSCGRRNPSDARFCLACGAPLEKRPAVEEERKVVSVVFVDLVGFTQRAERLDPEEVASLLGPFWEHVRSELERYSGTVEKFVGDAVMALFGAPVGHEDDAERAMRAALAIRDWAREEPTTAVHIGVATGEVLVRLHAAAAGEGIAVGDVVNTAARLQAAAPVNAVLVDRATYEATKDVIDYRPARPVVAKGKASPVPTWEPTSAASRALHAPTVRTAFVGRPTELALLHTIFRRVVDDRSPQLVTIVGPAGIGKTRLVHELHQAFERAQPLEWLHGRALPYGEGTTLWALAEIVKRWAGILETDGPARACDKLTRTAQKLFGDPAEAQAADLHLRALIGLPGAIDLTGDSRIESFAAWRRLIEAIAARAPLVLVFEDLQWADDALLEFVDYLLEWTLACPILILCTARPELLERRTAWGGGKQNAMTLSLGPLAEAETEALLAALLGCEPSAVARELITLTGGNPLYAEQFARMLAEGGSTGRTLPPSVRAVIGGRLDLLPPEEKQLLEDAAVAGTVFWPGAVTAIGSLARADVDASLHRLERKDLVVRRLETTVAGEPEYAFQHPLVCDVAYARIPRAKRIEKHQRAAKWLESVARTDDHVETLAHHYEQALAAARAIRAPTTELELRTRQALRRAGERALALNAYAAAARQFRAALDLCTSDAPERPRLLLRLAHARWVTEAAGEEELLEARDALLTGGDREGAAEAEGLLSELYWYRGDRGASWAHLDAAAELVRDAAPSPAKAYVLARLSRQLMLASSYEEAISIGREALALAERFDLQELRANTLNSIGSARTRAGDREGMRDVERAIEIGVAAGSRAAVVGYNNLASLHGELGDLRRSDELLHEARRLAERLGDRSYVDWSERALAARSYSTGEWDALTAFAEKVAAAPAESHYLDGIVHCTHAIVLQARGEDERAAVEAARGETEARRVGDPQVLLASLAGCAFVELLAGRRDDAVAHAQEVLRLARASGYLPSGASFELCVVLCGCGRSDDLIELLDDLSQSSRWFDAARAYAAGDLVRAADLYEQVGTVAAEAYVRLRAADSLAAEGRPDEAAAQRTRAVSFYRAVGALRMLEPSRAEPLRAEPLRAGAPT
jgi:predicted ATPase/class 3 adenylate cyclase